MNWTRGEIAMVDLILSATGLGATMLSCGIAIVLVFFFHRTYKQISSPVLNNTIPHYIAYKKLSMAGARFALLVTISSLLVAILAVLLLSAQAIYPRVFVFVGISLCIIIAPCLVLPRFLFDMLALLYVDTPALLEFQGTDTAAGEVMASRLRSVFLGQCVNDRRYKSIFIPSLSSFLLLEAAGIFFLFNLQRYLWLVPALAVSLRILDGLAKNYTFKWTTRVEPLKQTSWTALEPRIRQFAELAGVEPGNVYVQSMVRVGSARSLVYGLRHPTLVLSDVFLKNSDWRQQDALVAIILCGIKRHMPLLTILFNLLTTLTFWMFLVTFSALIASLDASVASGATLMTWTTTLTLFVILVILRLFIKNRLAAQLHAAMDLTGDPLALMVAIQTLDLLTATLSFHFAWLSKHLKRLKQLATRSGPRAPWANRAVPSIAPLYIGSQMLTIPLEQASPPKPVADVPYPEATLDLLVVPN